MQIGSTIFVDFDNVFTALWGIDEGLAILHSFCPSDLCCGVK